MRRWAAALAAVGTLALATAHSQDYPNRPIKLVVGYAAGGANDVIARVVAKRMAEILGQPVVIDNRIGAGGTIGAHAVATAPPDGYTLLMAAGAHALAPSLYAKLPYDVLADFTTVGQVGRGGYVLAVNPAVPATTVQELVALSRTKQGLRYASSGTGAPPHLAGELFNAMSGTRLQHIPYKAELAGLNDMVAGHVDMGFLSIGNTAPLARAGRLRAIAVTGAKRSAIFPDLPTIAEAGYPGYDIGTWWGVLAPAKTPRDVVAKLSATLQKIVAEPEYRSQLVVQSMEPEFSTPEEFGAFFRTEKERYAGIARAAGVKPE